jgi:hypothetical protein
VENRRLSQGTVDRFFWFWEELVNSTACAIWAQMQPKRALGREQTSTNMLIAKRSLASLYSAAINRMTGQEQ